MMVVFGRAYEQFVRDTFNPSKEDANPTDWRELTTLAWLTDPVADKQENECNFLRGMRKNRNLICVAIVNFVLFFHVFENVQTTFDPKILEKVSLQFCFGFFMLMCYLVHCKMAQELKRHQESESIGLGKKVNDLSSKKRQ